MLRPLVSAPAPSGPNNALLQPWARSHGFRGALRRQALLDAAAQHRNEGQRHQRPALEPRCRDITRPALADEREQTDAAGHVVLKLKTAWRDGITHLLMPQQPEPPAPAAVPAECEAGCPHHRPVRLSWARLFKRVFEIDRLLLVSPSTTLRWARSAGGSLAMGLAALRCAAMGLDSAFPRAAFEGARTLRRALSAAARSSRAPAPGHPARRATDRATRASGPG